MITRWHYCISVEIGIGWIHWIVNVSEADNIYKNPPPNVTSPIFFCYFYFALGLHP